jgi:hypothetical protein
MDPMPRCLEEFGDYPERVAGDWWTHLWVRPDPAETDYARTIGYALSIDGGCCVVVDGSPHWQCTGCGWLGRRTGRQGGLGEPG